MAGKFVFRLGVVIIITLAICFLAYIQAIPQQAVEALLFAILGFAAGYLGNNIYNGVKGQ